MTNKIFTQELSFGEIFSEAIRIMKNNFKLFLIFSFFIIISNIFVEIYIDKIEFINTVEIINAFLVIIISFVSLIAFVAFIKIVEDDIFQTNKTFNEYFSFSIRKFIPFTLTYLAYLLFIGTSFILLIIPGFIVMTYLYFMPFAFVLRTYSSPIEAMKYSYNLVKENFKKVFFYSLLVFLNEIVSASYQDVITYFYGTDYSYSLLINITIDILLIIPSTLLLAIQVILMINLEAKKGYYIEEDNDKNEEIDEDNNDLENLTTNNN